MFISIIIPIYNVAPYVEQCLQSVTTQTYGGEMECILVDDCGSDDSIAICKQYVAQYNGPIQFRIIHHEQNRGASAARNTGINAAKGDYVYFIDGDDRIVPECLKLLADMLIEYPQSQIVFAGATSNNGDWKCLDYTNKSFPEFSNDKKWLCISMLKRFVLGMMPWNKLILRDFLIKNSLYFVEGIVLEDEVWNFDLSKHIQAGSFANVNTYFYNVHPNSVMSITSEEIRQKRLFNIWSILISRIGGEREKLQIRGIFKYIYEETPKNLPLQKKFLLSWLYFKLGVKSCDVFSLRLFYYGFRALC